MTPERKAEMRARSRNLSLGADLNEVSNDIVDLLDALDAAEAQAASLRVKLQHAHGALYFYRAPEDVTQPLSDWQWNQEAVRDIRAHCDLPALLDKTRPTADEGMELLVEVRELRASRERLERDLESASQAFDIESHRIEQIAKYVNADGYVDSIGPILDAIDALRGTVEPRAALDEEETHG